MQTKTVAMGRAGAFRIVTKPSEKRLWLSLSLNNERYVLQRMRESYRYGREVVREQERKVQVMARHLVKLRLLRTKQG